MTWLFVRNHKALYAPAMDVTGLPRLKATSLLSGPIGVVLLLDEGTNAQARELARRLTPDADYRVEQPHLTLYHGQFVDVPTDRVQELLCLLQELLSGLSFGFRNIDVFGDKFLFWHVEEPDARLLNAHEASLALASFLDRSRAPAAMQEDLALTNEEAENLARYGHPLVGELWLPHATLAFHGTGLPAMSAQKRWAMCSPVRVALARIGPHGRITGIYDEL